MKKIYIIFPLMFLILVAFISENNQNEKNKLIMELLKESLKNYHYEAENIDNEFSEQVYKLYLEKLDFNKRFFLQSDINKLSAYKFKVDDDVNSGNFEFFNLSKEIYKERVSEVNKYIESALKNPFDFSDDEYLELDPEKRNYVADKKELKEFWYKYLKYNAMTKLATKIKIQEDAKKDNDSSFSQKSIKELEEKSREELKKTYEDWYYRLSKIDDDDLIELLFNSIAEFFDPHSGYFPPEDKENFDISISGQLEGIGATLSQPNAYIKVERIVPGSACWKQGELEVGDLILKVAQADNEPVDVVDMRLDEAIKMIRGKKGTEVRLTVKKADGIIKIIPIIRDVVVIEETYAKSAVMTEIGSDKRIGYIYLPQFYVSFKNNKGRRCSEDIKKEIIKLKEDSVDGLIIDLRSNGGGSLIDAIDIVGYFIDEGPVVQVRSRYGLPQVLEDDDKGVLYDDDLIIMVNEFSASASEIMAAAIQDYNRGIIVGSKTFGKGTVQRFLPFDRMVKQKTEFKPLGDLKITVQKFYRINGGATQLKGVMPDIIFPDAYSKLDMGEKDLDNAIKWDEIPKANYTEYENIYESEKLKNKSHKRVSADTSFMIIEEYSEYLKQMRDITKVSLNLKKHIKEEEERNKVSKRFRNADRRKSNIDIYFNKTDSLTYMNDSIKSKAMQAWFKNLKKDIYLEETFKIANDIK